MTAARTYTVHKRHAEDASVGKYYFPFVLVSGYVGTIDRGVLFLTVVGWLIGVVLDVQSEGGEEERSATATRIHLLFKNGVDSLLSLDFSYSSRYGCFVEETWQNTCRTADGEVMRGLVPIYSFSTCGRAGDGSSSASSKALLTVGPDL